MTLDKNFRVNLMAFNRFLSIYIPSGFKTGGKVEVKARVRVWTGIKTSIGTEI